MKAFGWEGEKVLRGCLSRGLAKAGEVIGYEALFQDRVARHRPGEVYSKSIQTSRCSIDPRDSLTRRQTAFESPSNRLMKAPAAQSFAFNVSLAMAPQLNPSIVVPDGSRCGRRRKRHRKPPMWHSRPRLFASTLTADRALPSHLSIPVKRRDIIAGDAFLLLHVPLDIPHAVPTISAMSTNALMPLKRQDCPNDAVSQCSSPEAFTLRRRGRLEIASVEALPHPPSY